MSSLRAGIVVTLVLSIFCVVGVPAATLLWSRAGHEQKEREQYAQLVSEGILLRQAFAIEPGGGRATTGVDKPAAISTARRGIRSPGCGNAARRNRLSDGVDQIQFGLACDSGKGSSPQRGTPDRSRRLDRACRRRNDWRCGVVCLPHHAPSFGSGTHRGNNRRGRCCSAIAGKRAG